MELKRHILLFTVLAFSFMAFSQSNFAPESTTKSQVNALLNISNSNSVNQATLVLLRDTLGYTITAKTEYNAEMEKNFQVMLFPNPSQDIISIRANEQMLDDNTRVMQLYNEKGELLDQSENFSSITTFNIEDYPIGNYYLRINLKEEQFYCTIKKLVKSSEQYTTLKE